MKAVRIYAPVQRALHELLSRRHATALAILVCAAILGLLLVPDYGQSWDETFNDEAGIRALSAYRPEALFRDQDDDYFHGTFYFMLYAGIPRLLSVARPGLDAVAVRHYLNFATFLVSVLAAYSLADRLGGRRGAVAVSLLMLAQPLYFGHAFINQKDIPFLAFFTASIAFGVGGTERIVRSADARPARTGDLGMAPDTLAGSIRQAWQQSTIVTRIAFASLLVLTLVILADLVAQRIILPGLQTLLGEAYRQQSSDILNRLFTTFAGEASRTPLTAYQAKLQVMYSELRIYAAVLVSAGLTVAWQLLFRPKYPTRVWFSPRQYLPLLPGAIALGLVSAVRAVGPSAGALVAFYLLSRLGKRAIPALVLYGLIGALVTYVAWPALWGDPLAKMWSRLSESAQFRAHNVFFEGKTLGSDDLPRHYVLKLIAAQFTESALIGLPLGLLAAWRARNRLAANGPLLRLLGLWLLLPILVQIIFRVPVYGNARQLLFSTVPLIVFAGIGWSSLMERFRRRWAQALVLLLALAPGVMHIIRFHPYEYVYYNSTLGGVRGAENRYELEFWCTSYRELTVFINATARSGAVLEAWGPAHIVSAYARPDLRVVALDQGARDADYVLACSKGLLDPTVASGFKVVHEVLRAGIVLGRVSSPASAP
jgi:hypothetical protein